MELKSRIKAKIVAVLVLLCIILYLLSVSNISVFSLLQGIDLNKVKVETDIRGDVKILDNSENIRAKTSTSDISDNILDLENAELTETDNQYIISGEIDSNLIDDSLNGKVNITHIFDKETREHIKSKIELNNKLDNKISEVVVNELSNTNTTLENNAENIVDVNSTSVITISPSENTNTVTLEDELKSKLDCLQMVSISDKIKQVTVNEKKYTLGETKYNEETQDNVKFYTNDTIIYGVKGKLENIKYLTEEEIKQELGEPTIVHNTKYWNISVDNEEINISLTDSTIDILYKHQ